MTKENIIYPLSDEVQPRNPDGGCMCNFCRHWHPLIEAVRSKLDDEGKKLFDEYVNYASEQEDDLAYYRCLANGDWEGWEILKDYHPSDLMPKPNDVKRRK